MVYSTHERRRNSAAYGGSYCSFCSREQSVEIKVHGRATTLRSDSKRTDRIGVSLLGLFADSGEPDATFKHRNSSEFQTVRYSYTRLAVSRRRKEREKRKIVGVSIGREWTRRLRETAVRHCAPAENSPQVCCQTRTCSEKVQHDVCRYGPCYRSPFFLSLAVRLHWRRVVLRAWTRLGRKNIRNTDDFIVRGILSRKSTANLYLTRKLPTRLFVFF